MKKLLMAAIAVFMMAGTSIASENVVVVENNVTTTVPDNAVDKLIKLIKLIDIIVMHFSYLLLIARCLRLYDLV